MQCAGFYDAPRLFRGQEAIDIYGGTLGELLCRKADQVLHLHLHLLLPLHLLLHLNLAACT